MWVVLGSAHPLTPPHRPHNSLYVISDQGEVVNRYDKRFCSNTEITRFYSPGFEPVVFDVDGYRFGCAICIEVNFPSLFVEYDSLGVDCLLLSAWPVDSIFFLKARSHAAIHNYWLSLSVPAQSAELMPSAIIGPDGSEITSTAPGGTRHRHAGPRCSRVPHCGRPGSPLARRREPGRHLPEPPRRRPAQR